MDGKAKVVLTDYVWESLDVEKKTLEGIADLIPLQTKKPEEFLPQAEDCTFAAMASVVDASCAQQFQPFISNSPWDHKPVLAQIGQDNVQKRQRPATIVQALG